MKPLNHRFCVAPMMDWTDRHCRAFHRTLSRGAWLYSEMVVADAVIHGDRDRLLGFSPLEHPLALQIGGSETEKIFQAARIGAEYGYDEINLNVGCPSDRVQSGRFGACLMREPELVADLFAAMRDAAPGLTCSIKCRIGVDEQDPECALFNLVDRAAAAGCQLFIIHARKAWLNGLSPKENRDVPPLDYDIVQRVKRARPDLEIILNGGLADLEAGRAAGEGLDGIMIGRAAYQTPALLLQVDPAFYDSPAPVRSSADAVCAYLPYISAQRDQGVPLHAMTRHMLGLFHAQPGGRQWRRVLSEDGVRPGAGLEVIESALACVASKANAAR